VAVWPVTAVKNSCQQADLCSFKQIKFFQLLLLNTVRNILGYLYILQMQIWACELIKSWWWSRKLDEVGYPTVKLTCLPYRMFMAVNCNTLQQLHLIETNFNTNCYTWYFYPLLLTNKSSPAHIKKLIKVHSSISELPKSSLLWDSCTRSLLRLQIITSVFTFKYENLNLTKTYLNALNVI